MIKQIKLYKIRKLKAFFINLKNSIRKKINYFLIKKIEI